MEDEKFNYFERTDQIHHREYIIAQNNCVLCGTVLELRYSHNQPNNNIKEEAYCAQCDLKTRTKDYSVH